VTLQRHVSQGVEKVRSCTAADAPEADEEGSPGAEKGSTGAMYIDVPQGESFERCSRRERPVASWARGLLSIWVIAAGTGSGGSGARRFEFKYFFIMKSLGLAVSLDACFRDALVFWDDF